MKNQLKKISILMLLIGIVIACSKKDDTTVVPKNTLKVNGVNYTVFIGSSGTYVEAACKSQGKVGSYLIGANNGKDSVYISFYNRSSATVNTPITAYSNACNFQALLATNVKSLTTSIMRSQAGGTMNLTTSDFTLTGAKFIDEYGDKKVITVEGTGDSK